MMISLDRIKHSDILESWLEAEIPAIHTWKKSHIESLYLLEVYMKRLCPGHNIRSGDVLTMFRSRMIKNYGSLTDSE